MKTPKLIITCVLAILMLACRKPDQSKSKITIAGNWKLVSDTGVSSVFNITSNYIYKGSAGDYYNFTSDNLIYIYERSAAGADTITYTGSLSKFSLDSVVTVEPLNGRQPYGAGTIYVKKLTANSLKIIYDNFGDPEGVGYDIMDFSR